MPHGFQIISIQTSCEEELPTSSVVTPFHDSEWIGYYVNLIHVTNSKTDSGH